MLLGFSIAAPVGPIGLLCIRRTLAHGRAAGFTTGLGAAAADCTYGFVAAFGLTAVSGALVNHEWWMRLLGGLFLRYLGLNALRSSPIVEAPASQGRGLFRSFGTTFLFTVANPATVLSILALFAGLGIAAAGSASGDGARLVAGVLTGSALWWFLLSGAASLLRQRFAPNAMLWVNRCSGLFLLSFGLASLLHK